MAKTTKAAEGQLDLGGSQAPKGLKIISLQAENLKRLTAVRIDPRGNLVEIRGRNAQGKQQPISEPVLTPKGWVPIGDIKIGDRVIGSSGFPIEVMGVFPQEERFTYRVTMADGGVTRCGPDHLWTVRFWRSAGGRKESERVTETLTTLQLIERGVRSNGGLSRRFALKPVDPVQFADQGFELPVDPYTLGIILGDGHIESTGYTTVTSWDAEILDAMAVDGWRSEHEIGTAAWSRPLRHLGLAGKRAWEKFVPRVYFRASVEERLAILAGLLDADGTAEGAAWASFATTSEQLARDVVELGSSVGWVCKMRDGATKKFRYNGELKEGRMAWDVGIKSPEAPFRLQRKLEKWRPSTQRGELLRHIDAIEPDAPEDSVCIQVAANDGLYVTKDFILTHNSSVLDAIWWALAGAGNIQADPIRKGQERAVIKLDLGELVVTRTFTKQDDGSFRTSIAVENGEGARYPSPQRMLDDLLGSLTFDPLAFARMKPKEQFDALKGFVPGIDFANIEGLNRADFEKRTAVNRRAKELTAQAQAIAIPESLPTERVDEDAIIAEIGEVGNHNATIERRQEGREAAKREAESFRAAAEECRQRAADLRRQADESDAQAATNDTEAATREEKLANADPLPAPKDAAAIRARLDDAKRTNALIDQAARRTQLQDQAKAAQAEAEALTANIAARDKAKLDAIAAAKLPIDGLGFGEDAITLNGLPFEQASDAERLRASCAIAMASNPKLRVIRVRDGSLLDEDGMRLLGEMADQHDCQVWVEAVDSSGRVGIVLEDGHVASTPESRAAMAQAAE